MISRRDGDAGFTLIEVLAVLAILGLMAGLVATRGPQRSAAVDLRAAAAQVAGALRLARTQAIAGNNPVAVLLDPAAHALRVGAAAPRRLPSGLLVSVISITEPGRPAITFAPDGSSTGGRVELAAGARRMQVGVDWLTGRVSVADAP